MNAPSSLAISNWLTKRLLPDGGYLVSLVEVYVDESGSHDGSPFLCLSAYVFRSDQAVTFNSEWSDLLRKYGLPYFHMVACAHGASPFNVLSKDQCIAAETEAIQIIRNRMEIGLSVTINEGEFASTVKAKAPHTNAYCFCLLSILEGVFHWARSRGFQGKAAYFFETGHKDQTAANALMTAVFKNEVGRDRFFYSAHAFGDKTEYLPLQAADVLAWQTFTDCKRQVSRGGAPRKDFAALVRAQDRHLQLDQERMRRLAFGTTQADLMVDILRDTLSLIARRSS